MFLRLRYYQSAQTRSAFGYVSKQVDAVSAHPSCPEPVKKGLNTARDLVRASCCVYLQRKELAAELPVIVCPAQVIRYGSSILQGQGQGQPQGAAQPAAR